MNKKGFTLIELLVVISIIGVLTALLLSNFVGIRERAKDAKLKAGLRELKTAMRLHYNDNQSYPATGAGGTFVGCSGGNCSEGDEFNSGVGGTVYMKNVPAYDNYNRTGGGDGFTIYVGLNNDSDQDMVQSQTDCVGSPTGTSDYYVCAD